MGPVVLEAGAVKLDLRNFADVTAAYRDLAATFGEALTAVLVQPMVRGARQRHGTKVPGNPVRSALPETT